MPHKVNPIDFENSEGNLGLANAVLKHMAEKLPVSRMQRDLTDSTVLRNIGVGFGYALLAYDSCLRGLNKLEVNAARLAAGPGRELGSAGRAGADRDAPLRHRKSVRAAEGTDARQGHFARTRCASSSARLAIPQEAKDLLLAMTPANYIGIAAKLARDI